MAVGQRIKNLTEMLQRAIIEQRQMCGQCGFYRMTEQDPDEVSLMQLPKEAIVFVPMKVKIKHNFNGNVDLTFDRRIFPFLRRRLKRGVPMELRSETGMKFHVNLVDFGEKNTLETEAVGPILTKEST